jgi:hypothetical protein
MDDSPKRSIGDTIGQLVVIAILIAILIGAVILLRDYVDSHKSSAPAPAKTAFSFQCCTGFNANAVYRPGEIVRLSWTPVQASPGAYPTRTIELSAQLSNSFVSPEAIKSATMSRALDMKNGPFTAGAGPIRVSNRSSKSATLTLRIPADAHSGYYELVTTTSQNDYSTSGASIFKIRR